MKFYEIFYKFDKKELDSLFLKIRDMENTTRELYSLKKTDPMVSYYLASIIRRIKELVDSLVEFNLDKG